MTKLLLLTGFLGAGKTTLLNKILLYCNHNGSKTAAIVNEYGAVGVDAQLLEKSRSGAIITELKNGSVFCACIKGDFIGALAQLSKLDFDYLFVEASGLADPANMESVLAEAVIAGGSMYEYLGAVSLVDALCFEKHVKVLPALTSQLKYSGAAIINKTDLVPEEQLGRVIAKVREINADLHIFLAVQCDVNLDALFQSCKTTRPPSESANTRESRLKAVVLKSENTLPKPELEAFIRDILPSSYRIKGWCGQYYVSATSGRYELETAESTGQNHTELVIISSAGISIVSAVIKPAQSYLGKYTLL